MTGCVVLRQVKARIGLAGGVRHSWLWLVIVVYVVVCFGRYVELRFVRVSKGMSMYGKVILKKEGKNGICKKTWVSLKNKTADCR